MNFLRWRQHKDAELNAEIQTHFDEAIRDRIARGEAPEEARANASREFGNVSLVKEVTREMWGWAWLERLSRDAQFGVRMLKKSPGFTLIAVLSLALGIGATTAIFSVVNGVLLRELPYRDEARLVTLWQNNLKSGVEREEVSPANFLDWRTRVQSCDIVAAAEPFAFNLSNDGEPETFRGWIVTEGFLEALGATPMHGRVFLPEEYQFGKGQVVVIGFGLWQRRFGGDPNLIGRQLVLNGQPHTVVGIMPPEFQYPVGRELWSPRMPRPNDTQVRSSTFMRVIGRLTPSRSVAEAQTEMNSIAGQLAHEYPQSNASTGAVVIPLREVLVGRMRQALLVLLGAVVCLLLIACANVASLLSARLMQRSREFAIRVAVGASRGSLLRQLLVESGLLALLGGAAGVVTAYWLIDLIVALSPADLPRIHQVGLKPAVLGFAIGVSLLTALMFGLAPALQLTTPKLQESLKSESRTMTGDARRRQFRNLLVVSEIALALMLLVGAGLLARSFVTLLQVNPGFATEHALTLETMIGRSRTPEQRIALVEQMRQRVISLPGVQSAAVSSALPFHDNQVTIPTGFQIESRATQTELSPTAYVISITPDYLRTMKIPLLRGRELNVFDKTGGAPVALINQSLATRHWPTEETIGKKVTLPVSGQMLTCEIVGVVGDVRPNGFDSEPRPEIYLPYAQSPASLVTWVVRTSDDPASQLAAVKEKIREANPAQSFLSIATLDQLADRTISQRRFNLLLLGAFAIVALMLAAIGLYGLVSFSTTQRTHEIGVRMALGAQTGDVLRLVIGQGLQLVLTGTALGMAGALALTRLMRGLLFGISANDTLTFIGVAGLLISVAFLACWIPARRATKVNPLIALRCD